MNVVKRAALRLFYNVRNAGTLLDCLAQGRPSRPRSRCVYVDVPDPNLERYYYLLLKFFDIAGFNLHIKANANLLLNLRNFGELTYKLPNLRICTGPPSNPVLRLTDQAMRSPSTDTVLVDTDYFREHKEPSSVVWPYTMHPEVYDAGLHNSLGEFRKCRRTIRIFLGGNLSNAYHVHGRMLSDVFGKINRSEITEYLETSIPNDKLVVVNDAERVEDAVRHDFAFQMLMVKKACFGIREWMRILSRSDFFIALPGVCMPFSHNAIEAMAVGTVPILQYPEMFHPPLEHMRNCIRYRNKAELKEIIEGLLLGTAEDATPLRANVADYYDRYLDPKAAVNRIVESRANGKRLYINAEHVSVAKLLRARGCAAHLDTLRS